MCNMCISDFRILFQVTYYVINILAVIISANDTPPANTCIPMATGSLKCEAFDTM